MNTNDYYMEAVRTYQEINKNYKHFSECCYRVHNRQTQELAQDCGCSVDTIENYRNAYTLYIEMGGPLIQTEGYASEPVRKCWEKANIALWVKAAQLRIRLNLSLNKTWDYLQTASLANMTRESFAAHIDEKENATPKWIRRLQSVIRFLSPSKYDYKSELPPEMQERYDRAVSAFVAELQEIAQAEPAQVELELEAG